MLSQIKIPSLFATVLIQHIRNIRTIRSGFIPIFKTIQKYYCRDKIPAYSFLWFIALIQGRTVPADSSPLIIPIFSICFIELDYRKLYPHFQVIAGTIVSRQIHPCFVYPHFCIYAGRNGWCKILSPFSAGHKEKSKPKKSACYLFLTRSPFK